MKSIRLVGGIAAAVLCAGIVIAEEEFDPEPIIEGRQAALRDIGGAFKNISDELKSSTPSVPTISSNARQIEELTRQQKFWFPAGTGPESDIETQAKPDIWKAPDEFQKLQRAFSEHAQKLVQVASAGNVPAIQAQWRELGKTCKGCHDQFREEEE